MIDLLKTRHGLHIQMEKQDDNVPSAMVVDSTMPPLMKKPPKTKDARKQEAGRLGAAARKTKEKQRLLDELTAVRERGFSEADVSSSVR